MRNHAWMSLPSPDVLRFLAPRIRDHVGTILVAMLSLCVVAGSSLVLPVLLRQLVNILIDSSIVDTRTALLVILALTGAAVGGYASAMLTQRVGFLLRNRLREELTEALLRKPLTFHHSVRSGELTSRAMDDIGRVQPLFATVIGPLFVNTAVSIGCMTLLVLLNVKAAMILFVLLLLPLPLLVRSGRRVLDHFRHATQAHADANALLEESLLGIRELQSFDREDFFLARYRDAQTRALDIEMAAADIQARIQHWMVAGLGVILLVVFILGMEGEFLAQWDAGVALAIVLYALFLANAVVSTGKVYLAFKGISGALHRTMQLLADDRASRPTGERKGPVLGEIAILSLTYAYDSRHPVIQNFSRRIEKGAWVVFTGPSGCGKSTLANILMGLLEPQAGSVSVDGVDLRQWDVRSLRSHIGYVAQEPILFHATLRENILFGREDVPEATLRRCIDVACVGEFLADLSDGLETIVGERGHTLSGGQRARVAVARALVNDPAILILDEANSVLGENLEQRLWRNLSQVRWGKTTIVFSHHIGFLPEGCTRVHLPDHVSFPG